ncbi:MAG TPA: DUF4440 domain-containing protein [Thermoanaerobaculaceae bacterium]|nr:DUF4440 domain-containing protein [Thermoanaerobaculaceae bacterium]
MASDSGVRTLLRQADHAFCAAFKRGSAMEVAALYTVDALVLPPNGEMVEGTNAIQEFWQGAIDMGITEVHLEPIEVEPHGDTAVEVGRYRLTVAGGREADQGKYLTVWKHVKGMWKLHRDIWNSSKPAPAS